MFRRRYANVFEAQREVERNRRLRERAVRLGAIEHLHPRAAVLGRFGAGARPDPADPRRAGAAGVGRFGDDRPHFARRLDRQPAARPASILQEHGVAQADFNSYGSRRGNDQVMARGTFANIRIRNALAPGTRGRRHPPLARRRTDADLRCRDEVQARGRAVGGAGRRPNTAPAAAATGPPRAPTCSGIRAAIASSFERIHRSNLVGMGILPLQLPAGPVVGTAGPHAAKRRSTSPVYRMRSDPAASCTFAPRPPTAQRRVFRESPHRHAGRARILPQRRHSADGLAETGKVSGRDLGIWGLKCSPQRRRDAEERKPSPRPCVSAVARPSQNPYRLPTPDGRPRG